MYHAPSLWPTRDGVVPYKMFYRMLAALETIRARERFEEATAIAHGIGIAFASKKDAVKVKSFTRRLLREAFPEE